MTVEPFEKNRKKLRDATGLLTNLYDTVWSEYPSVIGRRKQNFLVDLNTIIGKIRRAEREYERLWK